MRIVANSIGMPRASRKEKLPIYEEWEATVSDFSETAPNGLRHLF